MRAGMYVNFHVHLCALVLVPGSPGIMWLSNKYKSNLRTSKASGKRGKAWRDPITGVRSGMGQGQGPPWSQRGSAEEGWYVSSAAGSMGADFPPKPETTRTDQDPKMWVHIIPREE